MRLVMPYALLLLALLPLWWRRERRQTLAYPTTGLLRQAPVNWRVRLHWLPWLLRVMALIALILALARPQWGVEVSRVYREGIAIAMVIDISSSMLAEDLELDGKPSNRLDVVKRTFRHFVEGNQIEEGQIQDTEQPLSGRAGDTLSLYSFALYGNGLSPPTLDHTALLALLEQVEIVQRTEEDGTAIGDAIVLASADLRQSENASKVILLLTDGTHNAGLVTPLQAAQAAKALGIKIYTIGVGTQGIAMMPVPKRGGGFELRPTSVYIDEDTLREIAATTGGQYFRATDTQALQAIYSEIDRLETGRNVSEQFQHYRELYPALIAAALLLLLLDSLLSQTVLRVWPGPEHV